jgi:hypothetical protein
MTGGGGRHLGTEDRKHTENSSFLLKFVRERTPRFDMNEFEKFFTIWKESYMKGSSIWKEFFRKRISDKNRACKKFPIIRNKS